MKDPTTKRQIEHGRKASNVLFDYDTFEYKIDPEMIYEEWWIEPVFGQNGGKIYRDQYIRRFSKRKKMFMYFDGAMFRKKFKKAQI